MPIFTKEDRTVLFIHVPKAGGSTVEKLFQVNGWREFLSIRGISQNRLKHVRIPPQHMHGDLLDTLLDLRHVEAVVMLVRNPFSRFVSGYGWQVSTQSTDLAPDAWIEHTLTQCQQNPSHFFNHFRPQHQFIPRSSPAHIFRLEDGGVEAICDLVGLAPPKSRWPWKTKTVWEKKSHVAPEARAVFEGWREEIERLYAEDYQRFGYDRETAHVAA
ncbi:MAG: sulfotransferase family 2 domain-containing protein [Pseudomonadota bacterium]